MARAIKDFINNMKSNNSGPNRDVTISNVGCGGHNRFNLKKGKLMIGNMSNMAVEDQYYSQQDYVGLSVAQKYALKMK
jgi:hypothetical protein